MTKTRIRTYAANLAEATLALENGADDLILESENLSLRSFLQSERRSSGENLISLSKTISQKFPQSQLSLQCDVMAHQEYLITLEKTLADLSATNSPISAIRCQDIGVAEFVRSRFERFEVHFITEIGNNNAEAVRFYKSAGYPSQTLSNELPKEAIATLTAQPDLSLELQVQGPLLIQYSRRRFLAGLLSRDIGTSHSIIRQAEDSQLPGRKFLFYDNPHGHFMYAHFDRCLLQFSEALRALNLSTWLIDGRAEKPAYITTALNSYRQIRDGKPVDPTSIASLTAFSGRPQKPGFFLSNRTDYDWRNPKIERRESECVLGYVVDVHRPQSVTLFPTDNISEGDKIEWILPTGKRISGVVQNLRDVLNKPLSNSANESLVKMNWLKGLTPGAYLVTGSK